MDPIRRRHFLPLLAVAAFVLLAGCGNEAKTKAPEPKTVHDRFAIKVGSQVVQMQLALLPHEMQQGLMYIKSMGANEGMIFIYDRPQQMSFWMRNTELPLDIGYFDSGGKLKEVYNLLPHDERPIQSLGVRQFALEMNQGWYRTHGLKPGDTIDLAALAEAIRARGLRPEQYRLNKHCPMKAWLWLLGLLFASSALGADKVRVLLLTGGHDYERKPYLRIYRDNPDVTLTHLEHSQGTADAWDRADLAAADVVVLYDMPRTITDAQKAKFLEMFARGTGLVVTHHALVSYQGWAGYERIIGGRWVEKPGKGGDPAAKPSGYEHDVDIPVVVAVPGHPIAAGLRDFTIHDEIYWDYRVGTDVTPLLTTTHPKSGNPLVWTRTEGRSRVAYVLLGHGPSAYGDANYRHLLANAIRWAAGKVDGDQGPCLRALA